MSSSVHIQTRSIDEHMMYVVRSYNLCTNKPSYAGCPERNVRFGRSYHNKLAFIEMASINIMKFVFMKKPREIIDSFFTTKNGQNVLSIMNNPSYISENTEKYLSSTNLILERELHGIEQN